MSALAGAIEKQLLRFEEEGLGQNGTDAARACQSGDGGDQMDEKGHEMAHSPKAAGRSRPSQFQADQQFAMDRFSVGASQLP